MYRRAHLTSGSASRSSESVADKVFAEAGFAPNPRDALAAWLDTALDGARPSTLPTGHATQYDWDTIASQA